MYTHTHTHTHIYIYIYIYIYTIRLLAVHNLKIILIPIINTHVKEVVVLTRGGTEAFMKHIAKLIMLLLLSSLMK